MRGKMKCSVCKGSGAGRDPVFGNPGKCYPCDGTGRAHRHEDNRTSCWICNNWSAAKRDAEALDSQK